MSPSAPPTSRVAAPGLDLPRWFTGFRPGQSEAISEILSHFRNGKRVVFLDAPTGSGKTVIGAAVSQYLANGLGPESFNADCCIDVAHTHTQPDGCCTEQRVAEDGPAKTKHRTVYVATTKSLQQQFIDDFPDARLIQGRANYPTESFPQRFPRVSTADCNKTSSSPCTLCSNPLQDPYFRAKRAALSAPLVIANTAYIMAEANTRRPGFSNLDLLITDECDHLENQLMSSVEIYLSERRRKKLGIEFPERKTKPEAWAEWLVSEALPKVQSALEALPPEPTNIDTLREQRWLIDLYERLSSVDLEQGWVYSGYDQGDIRFRPIRVADYAGPMWFRHAKRHLMMSATIISAEQMAFDLGLEDHEWALVQMDSSFPPERCPVYVRPVANVSRKADERHLLVPALEKIMADHPDERILVHTVSYDLTRYLYESLTSPRVSCYQSGRDRERALKTFRTTPAAVLLAPSLDRGIDLAGDAARVVVVAKMPFASLGDKQVNARLRSPGGQTWYAVQTVRILVQMFGRAMRSADDWAIGYVLDQQFMSNVWGRSRHLIPGWFKRRIDWHERRKVVTD